MKHLIKKIFVYDEEKKLWNTIEDDGEILDMIDLSYGNFATITKENSIKFFKNFEIDKLLSVDLLPVRYLQSHKRDYIIVALHSENKYIIRIIKIDKLESANKNSEDIETITNLAGFFDWRIISISIDNIFIIYNINSIYVLNVI